MFHSAGTLRKVEATGTSPVGVATTKSSMPCWRAFMPVAIVVQITGERP
jgi:hypothetical protein